MVRSLIGWLLLAAAPAVGIPVGYELLMVHVESHALEGVNGVCGAACSAVATSELADFFASTLGVPIPVLGMGWFGGLALLSLILLVIAWRDRTTHRDTSAALASAEAGSADANREPEPRQPPLTGILLVFLYALGVLASLALLIVSLVVIEELCPLCTIIHACNFGGLIGAWLVMRRGPLCVTGTMIRRAGQMALHPATVAFLVGAAGTAFAAELRHRVLVEQITTSDYLITKLIGTRIDRDVSRPDAPAMGPDDAPVQIVAFVEFTCPHCMRLIGNLIALQQEFGPKLRIEFRQFIDPKQTSDRAKAARYAALAGICANRENRYWRLLDQFAQEQPKIKDPETMRPLIEAAGLDADEIHACTTSAAARAVLAEDIELGRALRLRYLPVFFLNRIWQVGNKPLEDLRGLVQAELARTR